MQSSQGRPNGSMRGGRAEDSLSTAEGLRQPVDLGCGLGSGGRWTLHQEGRITAFLRHARSAHRPDSSIRALGSLLHSSSPSPDLPCPDSTHLPAQSASVTKTAFPCWRPAFSPHLLLLILALRGRCASAQPGSPAPRKCISSFGGVEVPSWHLRGPHPMPP